MSSSEKSLEDVAFALAQACKAVLESTWRTRSPIFEGNIVVDSQTEERLVRAVSEYRALGTGKPLHDAVCHVNSGGVCNCPAAAFGRPT